LIELKRSLHEIWRFANCLVVTADYDYDGLERLAIRTTQNMTPAGTTHYVYDRDGHLIAEATNTGTTTREYVWLDDMPLAVVADVDTANPNLYYVHADHLDRPLKMTDGSEAVVWDAVYNPFGDVNAITGSASNNLRFPGQYFLIEAGLHYNWHRHYDPTLGRYTQTDPLGFVDGPNLFSYAKSAPQQNVDPPGLQVGQAAIAAGSAAARGGAAGIAIICARHPALCAGTAAAAAQVWNYCRRAIGPPDGDKDPDCEGEIRQARRDCAEAYANGWRGDFGTGPYRNPRAHRWTIADCVRGRVSQRCGGNRVD
jgi:RHS repeat-associated protein